MPGVVLHGRVEDKQPELLETSPTHHVARELEPIEHLDFESVGCGEDRSPDQGRRLIHLATPFEDHFDISPESGGQGFKRCGNPALHHLGGPTPLDSGCGGMVAENGDTTPGPTLEGQPAVVAQEDHRRGRRVPDECLVLFVRFPRAPDLGRAVQSSGVVQPSQKPAYRIVEISDGQAAVLDQIGNPGTEGSSGPGHLQVESGSERRPAIRHGKPVGHDKTVEAPFLAQQIDQESRLLGQPAPVEAVVGRHDGHGAPLPDGQFERDKVELAEGALVDDGAHGIALVLGLICHEVLHRGECARRLHTAHVSRSQPAAEKRVLRVAFEVASGEWRAVQVDGGRQQSLAAAVERFAADKRTQLLDEVLDPRSHPARNRTGYRWRDRRRCRGSSVPWRRSGRR